MSLKYEVSFCELKHGGFPIIVIVELCAISCCVGIVTVVCCDKIISFLPNPHNRHPHSLPIGVRYGVAFVDLNSVSNSASVTTLLYENVLKLSSLIWAYMIPVLKIYKFRSEIIMLLCNCSFTNAQFPIALTFPWDKPVYSDWPTSGWVVGIRPSITIAPTYQHSDIKCIPESWGGHPCIWYCFLGFVSQI